jgi:hypothetical protein
MHIASVLVAQPRAPHAQLALGQRDYTAPGTMPQHRPALAPAPLGAGQFLCRQYQQLLGQPDGGVVNQFVDAGLRVFE